MAKRTWKYARLASLLPVLMALYQVGCLPDGSFSNVLADNIVLTSAIVVQSVTSILFNTLFGVI